jgi:hypothetical protein
VKLRGRARCQAALGSNEALQAVPKRPEGRRGRTMSPGAPGAKQEAFHGPLQRLLGGCGESARSVTSCHAKYGARKSRIGAVATPGVYPS